MNNNWAFLPMRSSSSLLDDPEALRSRFEEDGYLYLDGVLDRDRIAAVHDAVVDELVDAGWVERRGNGEPWCLVEPIQEGENAYFEAYDRVQRLEQFHLLAHDPALHAAVETALGGRAFAIPSKIARLVFPGNFEHSTPPPHQDDPNNQGDPRLTATWIPLHDQPEEMGGLAGARRLAPLRPPAPESALGSGQPSGCTPLAGARGVPLGDHQLSRR